MVSKIADMIKIEHNRHLTQSQAAPMDLIFTGHSAGGAVAALLFTHMMHGSREDYPIKDLTQLRDEFRNTHCITFAAPPISTPALNKTTRSKALFLSIIHEGDPVPRADEAYMQWLVGVYLQARDHPRTPPARLRQNAGVPLLLTSLYEDDDDEDGDNNTGGEQEISLVRFDDTGPGSLDSMVMGDIRMHKMNECLTSMRIMPTRVDDK